MQIPRLLAARRRGLRHQAGLRIVPDVPMTRSKPADELVDVSPSRD
jgi:hypothetical protein